MSEQACRKQLPHPPNFGRSEGAAGQWRRAALLLAYSDFQTLRHPWGYNEYGTLTGLLANACPEIAPFPLCYAETFGPETLNKYISTNCGLACFYLMKTKSCF